MATASAPPTNSRTSVAVRNGALQPQGTTTALAIRAGQEEFNEKQSAALVAMGVSPKATRAELAVFFHQCQRTQLDPFQKQIYLIHRRQKDGDRWVDKPTTQVGIDGFRVIRDRIAKREGYRVEYEDTLWYTADGQAYDVWLWDEPPAACKVTVLVDGRRFPSVLRFNEYCQRNAKTGDRTGKWRDAFAHQIEKCAEADALRRAFPHDMAGVILEDAAPLDDPDAPASGAKRPTAAEIRQQRKPVQAKAEPVDAEVVREEESPFTGQEPPAPDLPDGTPAAVTAQGKRLKLTVAQTAAAVDAIRGGADAIDWDAVTGQLAGYETRDDLVADLELSL